MPMILKVPGKELFDSENNRFISVKETQLTLEHSLLSISRWESKWQKPYLSRENKTKEELIDYVRCMTLTQNVGADVYKAIDGKQMQQVLNYIQDPHTATTIKKQDRKTSRRNITNELIYYWMTELNIPFDPCEKWHFNRLLTLIEVASIEKSPKKKMSPKEAAQQRASLNAARRAKHRTRG